VLGGEVARLPIRRCLRTRSEQELAVVAVYWSKLLGTPEAIRQLVVDEIRNLDPEIQKWWWDRIRAGAS
jgi:hypothetical protein